ncbi:MAG: recombinase family protein [Firmicutes bacterium]|nr:recombinase family protein [Bacillota bacterium]
MENQKRAWIYCRVNALEDDRGRLKGQKKELSDYAEQMGFEVAGASQDTGSGLCLDSSGLSEVTDAAAAGKMDVLLVVNTSRLGRNAMKTMDFIRRLNQQGIRVYSPLEGDITAKTHYEIYSHIINTLEL